jgi:tRNA A-37 threonylcarbamoyl transferase component Bud32
LTTLKEYAHASNDFRSAFDYYQLKELTKEEAEALVRTNGTIEYDVRAVGRVRSLSGNNPFLLNLLCQDLVDVLREANRNYCLIEDIDAVVSRQLERGEDSKVWRYLEYLLRKDEEDHGAQIPEYPALVALANALRNRGDLRTHVSISEIAGDMEAQGVECDRSTLETYLNSAVKTELVDQASHRYGIKTGWLSEWLGESKRLVPVRSHGTDELVLNRYRVGHLVTPGGQADVWEAFDSTKGDARVVLKIYRADSSESRAQWFEREAKSLYAVNHPGVVTLIDHDVDQRRGYVLVLKPVPGRSLRKLLDTKPTDSASLIGSGGDLRTQVGFLQELAEALSSCHQSGVVHKDLSPGNIMVREDYGRWRPVLIDFGLASYPGEEQPAVTSMQHTPGYLPPEKYDGRPRKPAGDIYCLGLIAYELLTGERAFPQLGDEAVQAQKSYDFRAVAEARPNVPSRLAVLVESMLHVDPGDRPDAVTVAKCFDATLEPDDWRDFVNAGLHEYGENDFGPALDKLMKGVLAPDADIRCREFIDGLEALSNVALGTGRLSSVASALVRRLCQSASVLGAGFPVTTATQLFRDLGAASADHESRIAIGSAIGTLCDAIESGGPIIALCDVLQLLMSSIRMPAFWDRREDLYYLFDEYVMSGLLDGTRLGFWCIECCQILYNSTAEYIESQLWLQRAAHCGIGELDEFRAALAKVRPVLESVGAKTLPETSEQDPVASFFSDVAEQEEPSKAVGSGEQGHFNVAKIQKWVTRIQRLFPWVVGVRRVRGAGAVAPYPTRILPLHEVSRHGKGLPSEMIPRIVPAVLDSSYSGSGKDRAIRINIILPQGVTAAQREAAAAKLSENKRIFPDGS